MKKARKLLALILALTVALTMGMATTVLSFADETTQHTITITNTDQNVSHTYEGYQIFKGKLDSTQQKLSDVAWGDGVDGDALLAKLKADATHGSKFTDCTTAAAVAKVLEGMTSTAGTDVAAGDIDAIADIIANSGALKDANKISFTGSGTSYTATVTGDGYYFIKDTTASTALQGETGSDTLSKYLLAVVKNTTIVAKDTGLTPEKEIVAGNTTVKTGTAAIGDTVTFKVTIPVPNTKKYVDHFVFDMVDQLPAGLTFTGITSVKVGTDDVAYTMKSPANYQVPDDPATATGGQEIKLVFSNFKANAEAKNWIGKDLVVTYTAVVNKDANFTPTGNLNEVKFDYSNDPNHDYNGDEPTGDDPMGETPKDQTKTLLTNIELTKTGDGGKVAALEGAEFEITSNDYNITLVTGETFEADENGTYYQLTDGTYTETAPTTETQDKYASTEVKYKKTTFSNTVTTPGETKKITVMTNADGKISLKGLKAGTYTIKETKAPTGYNLDNTTYTIVLGLDGNVQAISGDGAAKIALTSSTPAGKVTFDGDTATAKLTIDDKSGSTLPETGGIGTTIFYILGALLIAVCGVVLIARRRIAAK